MPLTADHVQAVLENAIVQAKLAPAEVAPGLAKTLAQAITPNLNDTLGSQTGLITTVKPTAPVMSVSEALVVRDAVSSVVVEADGESIVSANLVAEALLIVGYVDVPAILASVRKEGVQPTIASSSELRQVTGPVSVGTGSVPAS